MKTKMLCSKGRFVAALSLVPLCPATVLGGDWFIEVGPALRGSEVKVSGSSYTQNLGLHNPMASGPLAPPSGVGNANTYGDRTYANGYVKQDPGTGNPSSLDPNTTWNWGFNNSSQYNAAAQTLTFQSTGAPGYTTLKNTSAGPDDSVFGGGFQAVVGRNFYESDDWSAGVFFKLQCIWNQDSKLNFSTYGESVNTITVADTYDTSKIGAANFPAGGYQGTYLGPLGTQPPPYPLLPNLPESRSETTSAALATSFNSVGVEVKSSMYQLGLGPNLSFKTPKWLEVSLRPALSLNIVDADVQRSEVFGGLSWSDHASDTGVMFGLGGTAGVNVNLPHGFYVGVSGGYTYVPDAMEVSVGPSTVTVDPSGWEVSGVFGCHF